MNIVKATKDDIHIIRALADTIWPHTYKDLMSGEQLAYMMDMMYSQRSLEEQMDNGHNFLLVEEDGEYLGYVSYEVNYQNSDTTKIHKIYILPSIQGKGIGRYFINAVAEMARANNNSELSLNVNRYNKAINFYERMGFKFVKTEDNDIGNGFFMEDYIMSYEL